MEEARTDIRGQIAAASVTSIIKEKTATDLSPPTAFKYSILFHFATLEPNICRGDGGE